MSGGRAVLITRAEEQGARTVARFREAGYDPAHVPCIELAPPPDPAALTYAVQRVAKYDWVVLTSQNAVARVHAEGAAQLPKIAAIGPETARAVRRLFGREPDLVPSAHRAEALADELVAALGPLPQRVVLFRAERGRDVLPVALAAAGHELELVITYTVRAAFDEAPRLGAWLRAHRSDQPPALIVFASSLTVECFFELVSAAEASVLDVARAFRFACISPVTAQTLRAQGVADAVVAPVHTVEGLLETLAAARTDVASGDVN